MDSTLSQNGIGNGSNVQVLRRLRGGAGAYLDIPGQWECKVCHANEVFGLLGSDAVGVMLLVKRFQTTFPWVLWDGRPPQTRSSGPPTRSSVPRHVSPRSTGVVSGSSPGAGVGPSPWQR